MRIVGLGGGIGASRLWTALATALDPGELTLVVNTGDDLWMHGLRICPDLDTTLYALSGRQDADRGWGVHGESWRCMDTLRELGQQVWFNLGDTDLATHLLRTGLLRAGAGLAAVTAQLAAAMGVAEQVLPMTEDDVATRVEIPGGRFLHYEEFLVRHGAMPSVQRVIYDGAVQATPAPGVLDALREADLVVLAPSNPLASVAPVLAVPGIRAALRRRGVEIVAVTPIVSRVPIADPGEERRAVSRAALLATVGVPPTAAGVAGLYRDLARRFVLDASDADQVDAVASLGVEPVVVPTLLHRGADPTDLVAAVLGARR